MAIGNELAFAAAEGLLAGSFRVQDLVFIMISANSETHRPVTRLTRRSQQVIIYLFKIGCIVLMNNK